MILRHVIIEGFKGIKDRVELELSPTLTAIYGPSYHGKSSILEAIQWCLCCNSLHHESERSRWIKIKEIFGDIKIVNIRRTKATVVIEYEHNGKPYIMKAETTTEEGFGFKPYDEGPFKNLPVGELEFTPFIRVITTSQIRRFESEEDLRALDIVFNVTFWTKLADSVKNVADEILNKEREIVEKTHKWRKDLEEIYIKALEQFEEAKVNAEGINIDDIRKDLAEKLNCELDKIPVNLENLLEFIRSIENPYSSKMQEKLEEKRELEEKLKSLESELKGIEDRINKIKGVLQEIWKDFKELSEYPSKDVLVKTRENLNARISKLNDLIRTLEDDMRKLEGSKFQKDRELKDLEALNGKILRLKKQLEEVRSKLEEYSEDLDKERENLSNELENLRKRKETLEKNLGEKLGIIKIIEEAIPLMKEDSCIICGEKGGLTRAKVRLNSLKEDEKEITKELEELSGRIKELEERLKKVEQKIREKTNLLNKAKALESEINTELRKYGLKSVEELEKRIKDLTDEINNFVNRINKLKEEIEEKEKERTETINKLGEINSIIVKVDNIEHRIRSKLADLGIDTWGLSIDDIKKKVEDLERELKSLEKEKENKESGIEDLRVNLSEIEKHVEKLRIEKEAFEDQRRYFEKQVRSLKEYEDAKMKMKEIELTIDGAVEYFKELEETLSQYERRRIFFLRLHKLINSFIDELIREKLSDLNEVTNKFFEALYDHPEFKKIKIEFNPNKKERYFIKVTDKDGNEHDIRIFSTSGRDMAKMAISSACSASSFYGLERSEFNLLIIDEPQQHLDSKHKEKFVRDFLPMICERCQVILATADNELWSLIKQYAPRDAILYEIVDWSIDKGPIIRRV